ncbi:MAG: UvrD-helicase domain-containing protein [Bdellovibrionota bacterium]
MANERERAWTSEQRELIAVDEKGLPRLARVAVAADAGAGKTSVLVQRLRNLARDKRVLCVSFTERSKADLEERLHDLWNAEVYTIHGFCARLVSEFGSLLGLSPLLRILDAEEASELFYACFEKVYRRSPPQNAEHGVQTFLQLCQRAHSKGGKVEIIDCAQAESGLEGFVEQVLAEFELLKAQVKALEYSDLERFALELIEQQQIAQVLQGRYSHVFVDEFQDTSREQCRFVKALAGARIPLFVVGDVKQSIYRFRGADVEVFKEFVAELPHLRRLSANFRSHVEVIDSVNRVCAPLLEDYVPMLASRPESGQAVYDSTLPRVCRVTSEKDSDGIAAVLARLRAHAVADRDVVLLLRRVRGNERLLTELVERGIHVSTVSSASASLDDSLGKLLNLWIWACEPWQSLRAAQVVVDFPWIFGNEINSRPLRADLASHLTRLAEQIQVPTPLSCDELLRLLDEKFKLRVYFGSLFEQFNLFILKHQSQGLLASTLARRFDRSLEDEGQVGGFSMLAPPPNLSNTLRVMTVHSAKGLEFPVVLLADLQARRSAGGAIIAQDRKVCLLGRDDKGALDKSSDQVKQALEAEDKAEAQESARLLYVAMTRAKESLFFVDRPDPGEEQKKPTQKISWAEWIRAAKPKTLPAGVFAVELASNASVPPVGSKEDSNEPIAGFGAPIEDAQPAYTRARLGVTELAQRLVQNEPMISLNPRNQSSRPKAREFGVAIHQYLELEDWEGLRLFSRGNQIDLTAFWKWFGSETGRQVFGGEHRAFREFAFEWKTSQGIVAGRVDLLVEARDEIWIIDYKVVSGKRDRDDFLVTYRPQLELYAEAVKKMTGHDRVRAFLIDITAATDSVWHEVLLISGHKLLA